MALTARGAASFGFSFGGALSTIITARHCRFGVDPQGFLSCDCGVFWLKKKRKQEELIDTQIFGKVQSGLHL
jgi:hypothetical protein